MKLGLIALAILPLSACDRPEVKACETFLKDGLKSPMSYRRIKVEKRDEKLTDAEWKALKRDNPLYAAMLPPPDLGHRIVTIDYDAENGFGATIRDQMECEFSTSSGNLADANDLDFAVKSAEARRDFLNLGRAGGIEAVKPEDVPAEPLYRCC